MERGRPTRGRQARAQGPKGAPGLSGLVYIQKTAPVIAPGAINGTPVIVNVYAVCAKVG
jgi:hypothetical protein